MASAGKDDVAAGIGALLAGPALQDAGSGRPILMLHGGGGPSTVAALSQTLSRAARVLTPTRLPSRSFADWIVEPVGTITWISMCPFTSL